MKICGFCRGSIQIREVQDSRESRSPRRVRCSFCASLLFDSQSSVRAGYGLVAIGHSELNGAQHWGSALEYGKRAGEKAATFS